MAQRPTTLGRILVNELLPGDLQSEEALLDKKGFTALMSELARRYPDRYRDISFKLSQLGRKVAQQTGGFSVGVDDLQRTKAADRIREELKPKFLEILADDSLDDKQRNQQIVLLFGEALSRQQNEVFNEALDRRNPLALQVLAGVRGNKMNVASMLGSDYLYSDSNDKALPFPILSGYPQGLADYGYWAQTYGTRKSVIDTKKATANAGYFSKKLNQAVHRLIVSDIDRDGDPDTIRGLPVSVDDADNEGALLASPTAGYNRNTLLTPKVINDLKRKGVKRMLVRSVLADGAPDGGIWARDAGLDENGNLPAVGDFVGLTRAQAASERISQGQLCLAAGTEVMTSVGEDILIERAVAGAPLVGVNHYGEPELTKACRHFNNGERECRTFYFQTDRGQIEIVCTDDHKFVAYDDRLDAPEFREVRAIDLKPGDDLPLIVQVGPRKWEVESATFSDFSFATELRETYDVEVSNTTHWYALGCGLITHNSSKHSGGVFGAEKAVSGFDLLEQLAESPKAFPGGAAHAKQDGIIRSIDKAPAGGHFIMVDDESHYVPEGHPLLVKPGDNVYAGQQMTEGIVNPRAVVETRHIGEGRRQFMNSFHAAMRDAGISVSRRNIEAIARGLVNHVKMTGEYEGFLHDDVVPYSAIEARWKPRPDAKRMNARQATGKFLEKPVLHYTVGTKIIPEFAKEMEEFGINEIDVHDDPPPFEPHYVRAMENLKYDDDWMVRMYGSNLQGGLLEAAHRGRVSDEASTSFVPSLARGVDFGHVPGSPIGNPKKIKFPKPLEPPVV